MTKPATPPPPKPLRWMGREWKMVRADVYRFGDWCLTFETHHRCERAMLMRLDTCLMMDVNAPTRRAALAKLARLVRAVGRLADG